MNDQLFQQLLRDTPPVVNVSQDTQTLTLTTPFRRVRLSQAAVKDYERSLAPDVKWWQRVTAFLSATNKAGRKAKVVKDAILIFLPFGKQVSNVTEFISQTYIKDMAQVEESKPASRSKTIITFALLTIVGVLSQFGIDLGLELSPDAEWLAIATGIIGTILRLVTKQPVKFLSNE